MGNTKAGAGRRILTFILKFGLAAAIITFLVWNNRRNLGAAFADFNYWWLAPALGCYLAHMVVSAWRWYELAKCLGFELGFGQSLSLTMQGYFFSLVIPGGAIGGDVARVGFLARRSRPGTRFDGAVTVLVDRIVGMVALFGLAMALMLAALPVLMAVEVPGAAWFPRFRVLVICGIFLLCLGGNAMMVALFFHRQLEKIPGFRRLMEFGNRLSRGFLFHLTGALDTYRSHWKRLVLLTLVSVFCIHLMTVAAVWLITLGMADGEVGFLTLTTAVTIGNIAGLIPLSLSGIGIRDVTIEVLLKAGGVTGVAVAIPLMYTVIVLLGNLVGGLFFITDSGRRKGAEEGGE